MNATIDNIQIIQGYREIIDSKESYNCYSEFIGLLPDNIKAIVKNEGGIHPKHLTQSVFKTMFITMLKTIEPRFKNDEYMDAAINTLSLYVRKDPAFLTLAKGLSFDKGILLRGRVGCGKTLLMQALSKTLSDIAFKDFRTKELTNRFSIIESWKISAWFSKYGFDLFDKIEINRQKSLESSNLCIDDIGSEPIASHYSNSSNIIGHILMERYIVFKGTGPLVTHATSNLDAKNLKAFYGDRVFSRMKEMFNDIILGGEDRRQ